MTLQTSNYRPNTNLLGLSVFGLMGVYYLQGIVYPEGSIISQSIILIYLLVGVFSFLRQFLVLNNPLSVKFWMFFCLIQVVTFLVSPKTVTGTTYEAIGTVSTFSQVKNILTFCLSLFIGLRIGKTGVPTKTIARIGFVLLVIAFLRFTHTKNMAMLLYRQQDITNNSSYYFVLLVPFIPIMYRHYKKLTIAAMFVIVSFTITGAKRGAIVCLAASLLFTLWWIYVKYGMSLKRLILISLAVVVISSFAFYKFQENTYLQTRMERMEKKGIGNRTIAYSVLLNHWIDDTNPMTQLFGNGSTQSVAVWGNYAHNDWLEILIDNGLLGVILYASFFIAAIVYIRRTKLSLDFKLCCYLFLIIWFGKTCFSMGYSETWASFPMLLYGMIIGSARKQRLTESKNQLNQ